MPNKSFIKVLLDRRIPQILGSYLVAGTSLILFIEYLVGKYQFPSQYPRYILKKNLLRFGKVIRYLFYRYLWFFPRYARA